MASAATTQSLENTLDSSPIGFEVLATAPSGARAGLMRTRRGWVETPIFMPVATHATIRMMGSEEIETLGARILLANTYHLMLKPGVEVFRHFGGIHEFMSWKGLVLTDSGGFQIFSLPNEREITEKGAMFRSFRDNSRQMLSPERSIEVQQAIGSDIMMVLDVCIDSTTDEAGTRDAMNLTHRWALRSLKAKQQVDTGQALFAIVQGGIQPSLRTESAAFLTEHPFDGFAIGGLAVGEPREQLYDMCGFTAPLLPSKKPRYLMGVGTPIDLVECVRRGVDMFDCIIPTKMAQQGYAYTFDGLLRLSRTAFRLSDEPLDSSCDCLACTRFSRGYIQHLTSDKHHLGARLLSVHNVRHYQVLMQKMRNAILEGTFESVYHELVERLTPPSRKKSEAST